MTYNDTSPVSRTEEAANHIIEYITSNRMQPGDRMPTEPELLEQLSVSRTTLREAVKTLSARNILEIRQGSGTYISKRCGVPDDPLGLTFIYDDDRLALNLLDIRMMSRRPHCLPPFMRPSINAKVCGYNAGWSKSSSKKMSRTAMRISSSMK